jgi:DNA repair protein RecO (recombination protein O)
MSSGKQRIDGQRAYILHTHPYSETSLVLDVFSREHGRLPLLARGARRPRSALRGMLQGFQPLELGWFGGGEVRTLAKAEWLGGMPLLGGTALMLGYYLNELLLKLLPRDDAHPLLFDAYERTLTTLSGKPGSTAAALKPSVGLRWFEKRLLGEIGWGLLLERDALSGAALEADGRYVYRIERGPVAVVRDDPDDPQGLVVHGKTLLDLAADDYSDDRTLFEARALMRMLINHHLSGQSLQSRRVFMELQAL